jgi:hypothetical protein
MLEDCYDGYMPPRFPGVKTKRGKQKILSKYRIPTVKVGRTVLVDPAVADAHLIKEFSRFGTTPRRQRSARKIVRGARGRIATLAPPPTIAQPDVTAAAKKTE